jgi:hypothetical protein
MTLFQSTCVTLSALALSSVAFATEVHPEPKTPSAEEMRAELSELSERMEALTKALEGQEMISSTRKRNGTTVHRIIEDPDSLRSAAREMEKALEDADIFESLAEIMIELSEDVTITEGDESFALAFKGREMASLETEGEERMTLRAGGRKITVEID